MQLMKLEQNENAEDEQNSTDAVPSAADDVSIFIYYYIIVIICVGLDSIHDSSLAHLLY